ncbi:MAG: Hsp70 family protein [Polyangiaceae bacterium]
MHVLQGERPMSADNVSLARFELTGIPPAPRGVPKIQVTFRIDADGVVDVDAKDLGTGRSTQVKVKPTSGLSARGRSVDRGVGAVQVGDEQRKQLAELKNQAETLLYTTDAALEGYADLVDPEVLANTKQQAADLRELLKAGTDLNAIREAYQKLEAMTFAIAESMYGGAGGDAPA